MSGYPSIFKSQTKMGVGLGVGVGVGVLNLLKNPPDRLLENLSPLYLSSYKREDSST